jgi:hypothetical protein
MRDEMGNVDRTLIAACALLSIPFVMVWILIAGL